MQGVAVDAKVGDEGDHVLNSWGYGEPVEVLKNGGDVVVFAVFHQRSGNAVLNELKFLKVFIGYTDEQAVKQ